MSDNPNQADGSQPGSEADGDSIEQAAEKEFDRGQAQTTQTLSEADKYVLSLKEKGEQEAVKGKLSDAVKDLQARDGLKSVHPKILEGQLHEKAASDEAFKQHFYDQDKNPAAWKGALDNLAGEVAEFVKPNSDKTTEDLAAANASVRGENINKEAPNSKIKSNTEFSKMSERQVAAYWNDRLE